MRGGVHYDELRVYPNGLPSNDSHRCELPEGGHLSHADVECSDCGRLWRHPFGKAWAEKRGPKLRVTIIGDPKSYKNALRKPHG